MNKRLLRYYNFLKDYNGTNPYILSVQHRYKVDKNFTMSDYEKEYIRENANKEKETINKVVTLTDFWAENLKNKFELTFTPKRILISFLFGETKKHYHVYAKFTQKGKGILLFLPKNQLITDMFFEELDVDIDLDGIKELDSKGRTPYPHQETGIKFLLERNGCILADSMGLGKTYMSTVGSIFASTEKENFKTLIICPSAVKYSWEKEINCFTEDVNVITTKTGWEPNRYTIINYDILKKFHKLKTKDEEGWSLIGDEKFDLIIIDEAHYLKNSKSKRGQIVIDIIENYCNPKVWLLTGTPIANRPMDFYNLLKLIKHPVTDDWVFYAKRYCQGRQIRKGNRKMWLTNGAANLDELNERAKQIMLRRLKENVLDLPDKTIVPLYHEFTSTEEKEYDNLWDGYLIARKKEGKGGRVNKELTELILLRKFIADKMVSRTIEMVEDILENTDNKVCIFTNFTEELLELQRHFKKKCVIHYGPLSDREKQNSVDRFQEDDKIRVFIGNIKSVGTGITLTKGNITFFNSYDWVPGNNEQTEDRIFRIGQEKNVTIYYQLFKDTISERMWDTLNNKKKIISTVVGDEYTEHEIIDKIIFDIIY